MLHRTDKMRFHRILSFQTNGLGFCLDVRWSFRALRKPLWCFLCMFNFQDHLSSAHSYAFDVSSCPYRPKYSEGSKKKGLFKMPPASPPSVSMASPRHSDKNVRNLTEDSLGAQQCLSLIPRLFSYCRSGVGEYHSP